MYQSDLDTACLKLVPLAPHSDKGCPGALSQMQVTKLQEAALLIPPIPAHLPPFSFLGLIQSSETNGKLLVSIRSCLRAKPGSL